MKTLSLVKFRDGLPREEAWRAWSEHTRRWDGKDHPEIRMTRLTLFGEGGDPGNGGWDGMGLTEWSSADAFHAAAAWYQTPDSAAHAADLGSFMDLERMLTVVIADECAIPGPPLAGSAS